MADSTELLPGYGLAVPLAAAQRAVAAAIAAAERQGLFMAVAVVDPAGALVAFGRVDGTQSGSSQVAVDKARGAVAFRRPTQVFADLVAKGRLNMLALNGAVPLGGGLPLVLERRVVGGIGVSGGSEAQDGEIAALGAASL